MKKTVAFFLALLMLGTLVACNAGGAEPQAGSLPSATPEDAADVADGQGGITKENIKIGMLYNTDPAEGAGYSYMHEMAMRYMRDQIGLDDAQIIRKIKVSDSDPTAVENAILECIEEGCKFVLATSWGYQDTVARLAEEYPDVYFYSAGRQGNGTNSANFFARIYQARYLSGIVAGMQTKTNKIGFVTAQGKTNSQVTGGISAFAMGVYSVNPDAKVYIKVTGSWYDPEGESAAARALIADGCDVIAQHCDTPNPQTAAEEAGVWGIGYYTDMSKDAPGATLTSVMINWGAYYELLVRSILDGTWDPSYSSGGVEIGITGLAPLADFCNPAAKQKVEEVQAAMMDGSFGVFDGEIETNDGRVIGEAGKTLDDDTIQDNMDWYFKNVVE